MLWTCRGIIHAQIGNRIPACENGGRTMAMHNHEMDGDPANKTQP